MADAPPGGDDGSDVTPDSGDTFKVLVERDWSLGATQPEDRQCRWVKITEDMYIVGFHAEAPAGTHHAMVTMTSTPQTTGNYHCDALKNETTLVYAGGIGVEDLMLPPGVAFKIPAGTYVHLNLHLSNETATATSGTSGLYVKTVPAAMVEHEADAAFLGNIGSLKTIGKATTSGPTTTAILGETQPPNDWHVVGFIPHMHQVGVKLRVDELAADLTPIKTRLDANYDVDLQHRYPVDFVVPANHHLSVTCTYVNATASDRFLGDQVFAEQCLTTMYRWPKETGTFADKFKSVTTSPQ
jgi:hypothetical protein